MKMIKKAVLASALAGMVSMPATAGEVEVLHYWTSGGEAAALGVLKKQLESEGHDWKDFAVAGGGGETAMTVLKSRAVSGNPPASSMIAGPDIQDWGDLGVLANMDAVAKKEKWDDLMPAVVRDIHKHNGHYVAAPVNVHRLNWLWINADALKKTGGKVPETWDEFFTFLDKAKAAGYVPIAHGGQDWQDATTFDAVVLGTAGPDFYKKAFVDLNTEALGSAKMAAAFETFKKLKGYMDPNMPGRDWNLATAMVIRGEAAAQIMGDWAKGEFTAAGKEPGKDYICAAVPGTGDAFSFNIDAFMMFKLRDAKNQSAQQTLTRLLMSRDFQEEFNLKKGSIPVRPDVPTDRFDSCALKSMKDFKASAKSGSLVPSAAHAMAMKADVGGAFYDVVTNYFNDDKMSGQDAADKLARAIKAAM